MISQHSRIIILTLLVLANTANGLVNGEKAPAFSLFSHNGKKVSLSDFKGRIVVLEWFNKGCPFVKKFYESRAMQEWQREFTFKNVIWLTISSSSSGKQGHETAKQTTATRQRLNINSSHNLLDHDGRVGKLYGAVTTPHIFILDKQHRLAYQGAVDSIISIEMSDIAKAENYLTAALDELINEKDIKIKRTRPYGCSVKY